MRFINFEAVYKKVLLNVHRITYGNKLTELLLKKAKEILAEKYESFKTS